MSSMKMPSKSLVMSPWPTKGGRKALAAESSGIGGRKVSGGSGCTSLT